MDYQQVLEKIIDLLIEQLTDRGVNAEELENAIEKAKSTGGDTSDIERLLNA